MLNLPGISCSDIKAPRYATSSLILSYHLQVSGTYQGFNIWTKTLIYIIPNLSIKLLFILATYRKLNNSLGLLISNYLHTTLLTIKLLTCFNITANMFIQSTIFGTITSFALLAFPVATFTIPSADGSAQSSPATQKRSSIDMKAACINEHGDTWTALKTGNGCYDWTCISLDGEKRLGLNLNLYCYETVVVRSYASCQKTAWDWPCETY